MKRLLVIRLGALGDLIHVSTALDAVKRGNPQMEIHLLTSPAYEALAEMIPAVDTVWAFDKRRGWGGFFRLVGQLRQVGVDGVVNLHPSFKSWLLTRLIAPVKAATYRKEKLKSKGKAQRAVSRRHAVADFYRPFAELLAAALPASLVPALALPETEKLFPMKPQGEQWVGLIPGVGAKRSNRAWEPAAYVGLVQKLLAKPGVKVLLIGGPDETALADSLLTQLSNLAEAQERLENHCGRHDIPGTARLLVQCDLVIGGDTGPMHLAAAMGAKLVAIYGPTSLQRTGPAAHGAMKAFTPPEDLGCWPCELPECPYGGEQHLACMRQISVDSVYTGCETLLR